MAPLHPEVVREGQRLKAMHFRESRSCLMPEITIVSRNELLVICYQRIKLEPAR